MNLDKLTSAELKQLQIEVDAAIKLRRKTDLKEAYKAVAATAAEYGFALEEVLSSGAKGSAKPAAEPKFRNPENPDQTWTGRGRKPLWFIKAINAGSELAELEI